jgi:hypothetical protein
MVGRRGVALDLRAETLHRRVHRAAPGALRIPPDLDEERALRDVLAFPLPEIAKESRFPRGERLGVVPPEHAFVLQVHHAAGERNAARALVQLVAIRCKGLGHVASRFTAREECMDPRHLLFALAFTVACSASKVHVGDENGDDSTPTGGEDSAAYEPQCADPGPSVCGNEASILRGTVRLAPGLKPKNTSGDLYIALAHEAYAGGQGGGFHWDTTVPDVDLSAGPVPFELDMCQGGDVVGGQLHVRARRRPDANGNNGPHWFPARRGRAIHAGARPHR